jgi:protein SCO1/2
MTTLETTPLRRIGAALLMALAALLAACTAPKPEAERYGGDFTLTAPDGSKVTRASLDGRPFAIYFGFTRCPDVCPTALSSLARQKKALGKDGEKLRVVFVSVDPGHDDPRLIGDYVSLFDTPILGLTGSEAQLKAVEKNFGVYAAKVPQPGGDYTMDHTAAVFLLNARGELVDTIGHNEPDPQAIAKMRKALG